MGTNITGIGNANAIGFKSRVTGGMYFPPELKDALVGVWSAYGKSNDSTDRNIIKNKIKDRGGDFELINFNYEGTSGYNGYPVIFGIGKTYGGMPSNVNFSYTVTPTTVNVTKFSITHGLIYSYLKRNGELETQNLDYPSYKIKVSGLEEGFGLMYQYNSKADATSVSALRIETNGIFTIPKSFASDGSLTNANVWVGFVFTGTEQEQCNVTIEVLPEYKGAVVTDGVDDLIVSQKAIQEILEGSNEITVVSLIHGFSAENTYTNVIRESGNNYIRNIASADNKTGIYGYTCKNTTKSIITEILGDKNDYKMDYVQSWSPISANAVFSVVGARGLYEKHSVAWYWTFIAKRVLTEDEINLVIEKYNLDRPGEIVKPDVYYDIKKQKITNENHSSFNNELVDFSGNGHNMKLYNIAWEGNSGIGNYPVVLGNQKTWNYLRPENDNWKYDLSSTSITIYKALSTSALLFTVIRQSGGTIKSVSIPSFKVNISGLQNEENIRYRYISNDNPSTYTDITITKNGEYELPACVPLQSDSTIFDAFIGFQVKLNNNQSNGLIISIQPEYPNGLCLDGVDDYGKVTGLPILKDYTVAADYIRTFAKESAQDSPILSKSKVAGSGAFLFNYLNADSITSSYSFGTNNILKEINDSERKIYYLSKYASDGHNVSAGSAVDYDTMWLGTYRDNTSNFFTGALYFAMLFPYSLSEFLLERQIKKARAGTLYPSQVEFRPIIPEDENITRIDYFVVDSGTWTVIKPGDYVDVGARIVFNVYTKLPYKVEKVSSPAFTGMGVGPSTGLNIFDVKGYIKDKTPQKIKLTLAINEDIVQWNPTITSNLLDSFTASSWYLNGWDNTLTVGTWIKKTDRVFFKATFKTELYGLETATFGGAECVVSKADNWSDSVNIWDIRMLGTVGDLSQVFNLDVYELIRFEDIVQPYPSFVKLENVDRTHTYTWGDKLKVGDTIRYHSSKNLLEGAYTLKGLLECNGTYVYDNDSHIIVAKQMVFAWTIKPVWSIDNNEPKCVLSPDRLQIPNSSYKILGHIPDISGHGNNGKINNSAYAEMSGANGYPYNYNNKEFSIQPGSEIINDTTFITHKLVPNVGIVKNTPLYKGKIKITGLNNELALHVYAKGYLDSETINSYKIYKDGIYDINIVGVTEVIYFHVVSLIDDVQNRDVSVTIQQIGEYEGSFCLDGVDDFVSIPTTVGGKQVLMKVNWNTSNIAILYDQRGYNNEFAIYNGMKDSDGNPVPAYQGRNNGQTYIDGILNSNIKASELKAIAHNITITNELSSGTNKTYPVIGSSKANAYFVNMALYDFMLFDEISTDDKIKELNEYIGIEKNVFAINPNISIDTPEAVKDIKIYQGGEEISSGYLYLNKDTEFEIYVSLNTGKYSLDTITVDGVEITKDRVVGEYNIFKFTLNGSSEQNITIHSYEYIMYEDIVQPYPVLLRFNDKNGNEVSWGGKFKVGSTITRIGSIADPESNLLNGLYSISGLSLNGKAVTSSTSIVEKQMVFRTTATWLLGDNEPKCIFSPSKLRMPNESYRYLGYIPDISGNGNNGVFNNFAFGGMSGVDGYPFNFRTITVLAKKVSFTDDTLVISRTSTSDQTWVLNLGKQSESFDLYVNWEDDSTRLLVWAKSGAIVSRYTLNKEWNNIPVVTDDYDYMYLSYVDSGVLGETTIKQKAKYEGSIHFDGVDDYITIPTLSHGGKQVLMKVNWSKNTFNEVLYDQRENLDVHTFAVHNHDSDTVTGESVVAYNSKNNGNTYIDGILNHNVKASELKDIEHNITITNELVNTDNSISPIIGTNKNRDAHYATMSLYDFMLFDEISTNEEIKELNNIVGIEGDYVQKPSYYWDAYGKTNFDIDKDIIPQRGTEKGYNFASFDDELDWYLTPNNGYIDVVSRNGYEITLKNLSTAVYGWYFQNSRVIGFITKDIPFKVKANKSIRVYWDMHSYKISSGENFGHVVSITTLNPNEDTSINLRHLTEEELAELDADKSRMYYLLWFDLSTLAIDEEVIIEMLPVEGGKSLALTNNNFAYDKMSGYGGYSFSSFNNVSDWAVRAGGSGLEVISRDGYSITFKKLAQGLDWDVSNNEYRYPTILNKELPFKCKSNKNVGLIWQLKYRTEGATTDSTITLLNQQLTPNVPLEVNLPYKTQDELTELGAIPTSIYYLLYFSNTTLDIGEEYTIEMLPLYPNGLVFDGVDDYSENTSIPALADYTYICKRSILNIPTNGATLLKGSHKTNGGAFIADYGNKWQFNFGQYNTIQGIVDGINWQTTNNFNGTPINKGNNTDDEGITVGRFSNGYTNMVFYKLFLYPRTIDMLSINMVKNMMEEDGIIDLTSKLFTDKYTGDFYEMDFNNDFLIGN